MKKNTRLGLVAALACSLAPFSAQAVTVDFESVALGSYNSIDVGDAILTYTGADPFEVQNQNTGPVSGHVVISAHSRNYDNSPFRVDFDYLVSSFSVDVGDYGADADNTNLAAYAADNTLLASDTFTNPPSATGGNLSVAAANIAYVLFWDEDPFPGAVYWDNLTFERAAAAVPEPGTALLLAPALLGLAGIARRRKVA